MPRQTRSILRRGARLAPLAVLAALAASPAAALAHEHRHDDSGASADAVVGHVYLDANTAGANSIAVLDRHADGSLTSDPASPVPAGGAGRGTGLPSQGAVAVAGGGRYLLAVDAGSNEISVLAIGRDGGLTPVPGSPFPSGGTEPVSVTAHHGLVYVANAGAAGPESVVGFSLSPDGRLSPIPGATEALPAGSGIGEVLLSHDATRLIDVRVNTSQIDSFAVAPDGGLTPAAGSPYPAQGLGPFGSAFDPAAPDQLYVTNAHNGAGLGTVSAFRDASDGSLSPIGASPFADGQTAPCWLAITPDGGHLFAVNTGSGTISRYAIEPDGSLTLLGSTPVRATGGVGAVDPTVSPDGRDLYVNETRAARVAAFAIDGGDLTELPSSPTALPSSVTAAAGIVSTNR